MGYITDSQDTTKSVTLEKESALSEYMAPKVSGNGNKVAIGWSTEKDGSNIIEDLDSFVPEKDTTLYAVWEEGYTITFDGNGGYLSDREGTYYVPSMKEVYKKNTDMYWVSFPMTSHPDDNMTFVGWYKDKGLTEQVNTKDDDVDKDMTLYAKWEKTVQVTFDANGWAFSDSGPNSERYIQRWTAGSILSSGSVDYMSAFNGKVVSGWYLNSDCTEDSKVDINNYMVTKDVTFYAKWENGIVVTYDACGGYYADSPGSTSGKSIAEYTIKKGDSIQWHYTTPRTNDAKKTFAGWYTDATYKNKVENISSYVPKENMTFYAKWDDAYTVTLDAGEGVITSSGLKTDVQTVSKGGKINYLPDCRNTNETRVFVGWYKEPTYETLVRYPFELTVNEDITLYAKWETGIKVILDACGGNFNGSETKNIYVLSGSEIGQKLVDPSFNDEHKRFSGWYRDKKYTQPINWSDSITQETTLYAKWEDLIKITLDANGGYFNNNTQNVKQNQYISKNIDMVWDLNHYWVPNNTDAHKAFDGCTACAGSIHGRALH